MENKINIGKDDSHINISEPQEVQYWSEKLNVPEEILKDAVRTAGTTFEEVREHLEENDYSKENASENVRLKDGPWKDAETNNKSNNPEGKSIEEATDPSKLSRL